MSIICVSIDDSYKSHRVMSALDQARLFTIITIILQPEALKKKKNSGRIKWAANIMKYRERFREIISVDDLFRYMPINPETAQNNSLIFKHPALKQLK